MSKLIKSKVRSQYVWVIKNTKIKGEKCYVNEFNDGIYGPLNEAMFFHDKDSAKYECCESGEKPVRVRISLHEK